MFLGEQIAVLMHKGSSVLHSFRRRKNSVKGFIFNLYRLFGFFQYFRGLGGDKGHGVPEIMRRLADRNDDIPVAFKMADLLCAGDVLRRHNAENAVHAFGFAFVYGEYLRPRILTP